jgi:5-formyltetrahydrofolate cyclo-ligase
MATLHLESDVERAHKTAQVLLDINTIDPGRMLPWDVPVDIIVTPTQVRYWATFMAHMST